MTTKINAGFLISYDYEFIKISLPIVYDHVDEIYFAVDKDRISWAGKPFNIENDFWLWIKEFDKESKITIYEDQFYIPELSPMECDTRERNLLGVRMGICDWYLQIDSDEYFVDFKAFVTKLRNYKSSVPTTIQCNVAVAFKQLSAGFLFIGDSKEMLCFATNNPVYNVARNNDTMNIQVFWNDLVIHQSWARTPEETYRKLNNWSHKNDFNIQSFYNLWNAVDEFNFYALNNFHPLDPPIWPNLKYLQGTLNEILNSGEVRQINKTESSKKKPFFSRMWKKVRESF